jgi:hypothetical protein
MDKKRLDDINKQIINCPNIKIKNPTCSRDPDAVPLVMEPKKTQRILLITRDPSNIANKNMTLLGWENTFFRNHILPIFYKEYDKTKAKKNRNYFEGFKELFSIITYWTHYSKCFPGIDVSGNHIKPNGTCSNLYLNNEILVVSPEYIILAGKDAHEFIMKTPTLEAINLNGTNYLNICNGPVPVICLTHPSNANNKCKNNPVYKFKDTVGMIQEIVLNLVSKVNHIINN